MNRYQIFASIAWLLVVVPMSKPVVADGANQPSVQLQRDDDKGRLVVLINGKESLVYLYGAELDLVHYYPVRSPSGKSMTVQSPQDHRHHRSLWFGEEVRLAGQRKVNFYSPMYSCRDPNDPKPPFRDHIRHAEFLPTVGRQDQPVICSKLVWEMDYKKPVLDELREMRVVPLNNGEYLLDIKFTVTASYGDVTFTSDWNHYAWPYVRMNPRFSAQQGGTITNSSGGINEKGAHGKEARWVDYSGTVEGQTEGLAIFSHADNDHPHRWLCRDYGCFGPRRIDVRSDRPFVLEKGRSLSRRVGILVHRGDVKGGHVAKRFKQYINGEL